MATFKPTSVLLIELNSSYFPLLIDTKITRIDWSLNRIRYVEVTCFPSILPFLWIFVKFHFSPPSKRSFTKTITPNFFLKIIVAHSYVVSWLKNFESRRFITFLTTMPRKWRFQVVFPWPFLGHFRRFSNINNFFISQRMLLISVSF